MSTGERVSTPAPEASGPAAAPTRQERRATGDRARLALMADVGRLVGVDLTDRVDLDGRARAHGATGLVTDGRVHLDDRWWRPDGTGRAVLVHEAVHLRQSELDRTPASHTSSGTDGAVGDAEAEAHRATASLLAGVEVPIALALAPTAVALDNGAATATDEPAVATAAPTGLAAHRLSDVEVQAQHEALVAILEQLVAGDDLDQADVDQALATLGGQPLDVAAAAVHVLDSADRTRLLGRVRSSQASARRDGVLAVLVGLDEGQVRELGPDLLASVDLIGLRPEQHRATVAVLGQLRHEVLTALLTEGAPNRESIDRLVGESSPSAPAADPRTVDAVVAAVREDVRPASRGGSIRALAHLAALSDEAASGTGRAGTERSAGDATAERSRADADRRAGATHEDGRPRLVRAAEALVVDGTLDRVIDGVGDDGRGSLSRDEVAMLDTLVALRATLPRRRVADADLERLRSLLSRSFTDWAVTDEDARRALPLMLRVARRDGSLLRRLDAEGYVDRLFDELDDDDLYRADVRGQTGEIMAERREEVLFDRAHDKLTRGFFDWAVTARDAYLASRMVEAMSADGQARFARLDGGAVYARLTDELTVSMQQAPDRHGLGAGTATRTREEARTLLSDPGTWTAERVETLRTLVNLAVTTGLGAWVFDRSRAYAAHRDPVVRERVVTPFALYDPDAGRDRWDPDVLEGTGFFSEGVFEFGGIVPLLLSYVPIIAPLFDRLGVDWRTRVRDRDEGRMRIRLDAVQEDVGRMTSGSRFGDAAATRAGPDLEGRTGRRTRLPGTNELVITDTPPSEQARGHAEVEAPAIELTGYRSIGPDGHIAFSGLVITDLVVSVDYPPGDAARDTQIDVHLESLALDDLVYAAEGDVYAASRVVTGESSVHTDARTEARGFVAWLSPLLGEMLALLDLSSRVGTVDARVEIGEVVVTGLLAAGQRIERLRITDLVAGQARDERGRLRLLVASLGRRRDREADPAARQRITHQLDAAWERLRSAERDLDRQRALESRFRADPASLDRRERRELRRLRGSGGYVLDAASITMEGVGDSADVEGPITLENVSGGTRVPGVGPLAPSAAERARTFLDRGPTAGMQVELHVGSATVGATTIPGDIPDEAVLATEINDLGEALDDAEAPVRGRLLERRTRLERALETELPRYRELERRAEATRWGTGGAVSTTVAPLTAGEERERARLRASLRDLGATRIGGTTATDVSVSTDLGGTLTEVRAATFTARDVGRGGGSIGEVRGTDFAARLHTSVPGTPGLTGLPGTLARAEVLRGDVHLTDVRRHGVRLVEGVALEGIRADVRPVNDVWEVDALHLDTLTVTGLRLVSGERVITTFPDDPALAAAPQDRTTTAEPTGGTTITLRGVDLRASLRTTEEGELSSATIQSLTIASLESPDPVRYRDATRDLRLSAESVRDITVTDLTVPLAEGMLPIPTGGTVRVDAITQLQVAGRLTDSLRGSFTIDGDPPDGATLQLTFREDGVDVTHLDLQTLQVAGLVFDDGTRRVEVGGPAVLEGITGQLGADITRGPDEDGEATAGLGGLAVDVLDVRRIVAPHVRYVEGATEIEAAGGFDEPDPIIEGLHVRGLRLGADLDLLGGSVGIDRAVVGVAGDFVDGVVGGVEAEVTRLRLRLGDGFRSISGSLGTSRVRGGVVLDDGTVAGGSLTGLSIGAFSWDEPTRTLRFGGDGPDDHGIHVDQVDIGPLQVATADLGIDIGTTDPGAATLTGVRFAASVQFQEAADGGTDWQQFRAELQEVHADSLAAEGVTLTFPRSGLTLTVPAGLGATAGPIDIVPNIPELLLVERSFRGPTGEYETSLQGRLEVARAVVPRLQAALGSRLAASTRLEVTGLELGMFASGDQTLRIDELRALDELRPLGADVWADLSAFGLGHIVYGPPTPAAAAGIDLQATLTSLHDALLPFGTVLNDADGHLRADLGLDWLPDQRIDLTITDGEVDLHRLEDALGNSGDMLLDFELTPPGLVLELDASDVLAPLGLGLGGLIGGGIGLTGNVDLLRWNLTTGETQRIENHQLLPLIRLLDARVVPWFNDLVRDQTAGAPTADIPPWRLSNIDLALDVLNPVDVPVSIPAFTTAGGTQVTSATTVVPANSLIGLRGAGNIPGPAGHLQLGVARFGLGRTDVEATTADGSTVEAGLDEVVVEGGSTTLHFHGGRGGMGGEALPPTSLEARLQRFTARGIDVRIRPPGSAPGPTTTTPSTGGGGGP